MQCKTYVTPLGTSGILLSTSACRGHMRECYDWLNLDFGAFDARVRFLSQSHVLQDSIMCTCRFQRVINEL